jgi:hypothetical protein
MHSARRDFHAVAVIGGSHRVAYGSDRHSWPAGTYGRDGIRQIVECSLKQVDMAAVSSGTIEAIEARGAANSLLTQFVLDRISCMREFDDAVVSAVR